MFLFHCRIRQFIVALFLVTIFGALQSITSEEGIKLVLTILKQVMEEKLNSNTVEVAIVSKDSGYRMFTKDEIDVTIKQIPT